MGKQQESKKGIPRKAHNPQRKIRIARGKERRLRNKLVRMLRHNGYAETLKFATAKMCRALLSEIRLKIERGNSERLKSRLEK